MESKMKRVTVNLTVYMELEVPDSHLFGDIEDELDELCYSFSVDEDSPVKIINTEIQEYDVQDGNEN